MYPIRDKMRRIPVENVIARDFELTQSGNYFRGVLHDSLIIDTKKNRFYWNSIGISGDGFDWLTKIRGLSPAKAIETLQEYSDVPLKRSLDLLFTPSYPYYKLAQVFYELGKGYRLYWYSRGYTDDIIDHFRLGYTGKWYVIPVFNGGTLVNFQCRTPEKKIWEWTSGLGIQPFNFNILDNTDWAVVTEGPADAIIATQHGFPAISWLSSALSWDKNLSGHFVRLNKIYLMFDNDKAGWRGLRRIGKNFSNKCWVIDWEGFPEKCDVGDILKQSGPAALSRLIDKCLPYKALDSQMSKEFYRRLRRQYG